MKTLIVLVVLVACASAGLIPLSYTTLTHNPLTVKVESKAEILPSLTYSLTPFSIAPLTIDTKPVEAEEKAEDPKEEKASPEEPKITVPITYTTGLHPITTYTTAVHPIATRLNPIISYTAPLTFAGAYNYNYVI